MIPVHSFSRSSILKVLASLLDENRKYFDSAQWYLQAQYPARFGGVSPQIEGLRLGLSCPSGSKGLRQGNRGAGGG